MAKTTKHKIKIPPIAIVFCLFPLVLSAQQRSLSGTISSDNSVRVPNAAVEYKAGNESFIDTTDIDGNYQLDLTSLAVAAIPGLPAEFRVGTNYPNPFNPTTRMPVQINEAGKLRIEVFDLLGRELAAHRAQVKPGNYIINLDLRLPASVYFVKTTLNGNSKISKILRADGSAGYSANISISSRGAPVQRTSLLKADASDSVIVYTNPGNGVHIQRTAQSITPPQGVARLDLFSDRIYRKPGLTVNQDSISGVRDSTYQIVFRTSTLEQDGRPIIVTPGLLENVEFSQINDSTFNIDFADSGNYSVRFTAEDALGTTNAKELNAQISLPAIIRTLEGLITSSGLPVFNAEVVYKTLSETFSDTTDNAGHYFLELGSLTGSGIDSLIITTDVNNGIYTTDNGREIVRPDTIQTLNINDIVRLLRAPVINGAEDITGTIDTVYSWVLSKSSPEFDVDSISINFTGENYTLNGDTLALSPTTAGIYIAIINATDNHGTIGLENINSTIESHIHNLQFTKLFGGLDDPQPGLRVVVKGKVDTSDVNGYVTFELPTTTNETDSLRITSPNGSIQEGTGQFYNMRLPVDFETIANADTQKVMTITDPYDQTYWDNYVWDNLIQREIYLSNASINSLYIFAKWGIVGEGYADSVHIYIPEFTSGPEGHPERLDYKETIQERLNFWNTKLDSIANGSSHLKFYETSDSLLVEQKGIIFDFSGLQNETDLNRRPDIETGNYYITDANVFISNVLNVPFISEFIKLIDHETFGHGTGLLNHSPYEVEKTDENMGAGAPENIQKHEILGTFLQLNYFPQNFRNIEGYRELGEYQLPQSISKIQTGTSP